MPFAATQSYTLTVIAADTTAPVITPSVACTLPGNAPWCRGDVTVTWTVTDGESAVTATSGCGPVTRG